MELNSVIKFSFNTKVHKDITVQKVGSTSHTNMNQHFVFTDSNYFQSLNDLQKLKERVCALIRLLLCCKTDDHKPVSWKHPLSTVRR